MHRTITSMVVALTEGPQAGGDIEPFSRKKAQQGCGGLGGDNPGAFPKAGPIFQLPFFSCLKDGSGKKFPAASFFLLLASAKCLGLAKSSLQEIRQAGLAMKGFVWEVPS